MADYLPASDNDFVAWLNNFQLKISVYSVALGISPADVTSVQNDHLTMSFSVAGVELFRAEAQERTAYKEILRDGPLGVAVPALPSVPVLAPPATVSLPGIEPRIRLMVRRIKASPAYNTAMGEDLGIIAPSSPPPATPQPTFTLKAQTDGVSIKWKKSGFKAVQIESKRGADAAWTNLGVKTTSPWLDVRANQTAGTPEVRQYRIHYIKDDAFAGDYSDIASVTVNL